MKHDEDTLAKTAQNDPQTSQQRYSKCEQFQNQPRAKVPMLTSEDGCQNKRQRCIQRVQASDLLLV